MSFKRRGRARFCGDALSRLSNRELKGTDIVRATHRNWIAALAALTVAWLGSAGADAQDKIIAKVDGKAITETDMKLAEAEIGSDLGSLPEGIKRRVLAEYLIENQLFAQAAERQKLGSGAAFDERLQYWRRRALRDAFFEKSVRDAVNEADAKKFYDQQVSTLKPEEEVRARHILVDSKEKARELYEKIQHGADFAELAKEHSKDPGSKDRGGDLGFFGRGQMIPQFEEAAFALKKGEVSQPVETQFGWHILRVDERRQRPTPPFDAVKDRIRAAMIHQKAQEIAADLRGKAQIEYIDSEIKKSVEEERAGGAKPK
jgi:peptidyl-prolyl cis-trans isomerase C